MTITLSLKPELEEQVRSRAEARGLSPEDYLTSLIEAQFVLVEPARASLEEFEAALDAMAEDTDDLPVLPPEALTREAIYADHD